MTDFDKAIEQAKAEVMQIIFFMLSAAHGTTHRFEIILVCELLAIFHESEKREGKLQVRNRCSNKNPPKAGEVFCIGGVGCSTLHT